MKIGFLIIDMQAIFLQGKLEKNIVDKACEYINYVSDVLRSNDHLVIHVQDVEGMEEINKESYDFIPEIEVETNDIRIAKEYSNAFWKTELEQVLSAHDVELVVIAGFAAEHCVLFTYNGAIERGFKPVLLQNAILSTNHDAVSSAYRDRNLVSYPVISYLAK